MHMHVASEVVAEQGIHLNLRTNICRTKALRQSQPEGLSRPTKGMRMCMSF